MTDSDGRGDGSLDPLTSRRSQAERDFARFGEWVAAFELEHGPTRVYLDSQQSQEATGPVSQGPVSQPGDRNS
jgi:hypothetical protein